MKDDIVYSASYDSLHFLMADDEFRNFLQKNSLTLKIENSSRFIYHSFGITVENESGKAFFNLYRDGNCGIFFITNFITYGKINSFHVQAIKYLLNLYMKHSTRICFYLAREDFYPDVIKELGFEELARYTNPNYKNKVNSRIIYIKKHC